MKSLTALLFFCILFQAACQKEKDIEVINLDNREYYSLNDSLSKVPALIKADSNFITQVKEMLLKQAGAHARFNSRIYLDETGEIVKIAVIEGINKSSDEFIIDEIKRMQFSPAEKNGKKVKAYLPIFVETDLGGFILSSQFIEYFGLNNQNIGGLEYAVAVEKMPEPADGIEGIQKKVKYPENAKNKGIAGKVYIQAFINERGTVDRTQVIRGADPELDEAASKAIRETKFYPGMQRGKPVKTQVSIPIVFKLQ